MAWPDSWNAVICLFFSSITILLLSGPEIDRAERRNKRKEEVKREEGNGRKISKRER